MKVYFADVEPSDVLIQRAHEAFDRFKARHRKMECAIGWLGGNPTAPFIIAVWYPEKPNSLIVEAMK